MIDIVQTDACVLCRACSTACPVGAITFTKEHGRFLYPEIRQDICVHCERCARVCPALNQPVIREASPKGFVAMSQDQENRGRSTSGGIFYELARSTLAAGGYVCGAVFTDDFSVHHVVSQDPLVVEKMRGSKYVQSDTTGVYEQVQTLLRQGIPVLFTGCPCQSAALRAYLKKEYDSLLVVDLICHGIPSDASWHTYLSMQEKKYGAPVTQVSFRSKDKGWHNSSMKLTFANGKTYLQSYTVDFYIKGFLQNYLLKESCYQCAFRGYRSGSDITLGDFWGAESEVESLDDNKGLSAVLVHTEKGQAALDSLALTIRPIDVSVIEAGNRNLLVSPPQNPEREAYFACVQTRGEEVAMKKYLKEKPMQTVRRVTRYRLRRIKHALQGRKTLY